MLDRDVTGPGGYFAVTCDVTDADQVAEPRSPWSSVRRLDIVVNNAGIGAPGDVAANGDDEWHRVLDVNVVGIARVTRAALPHLRQSPGPHREPPRSWRRSASAARALPASKGAVLSLTLAMAADHVRDGIRVNAVTPGTADTPWVGRLLDAADDPAAAAALEARQPMGRLVTPAEVANAIVYLASPRSSSTTGTLLAVDGGMPGSVAAGPAHNHTWPLTEPSLQPAS